MAGPTAAVTSDPVEPDEAANPVRVAIMGSCITRDNFNRVFNPTYKSMYATVLMQNQASVISLMSEGFALAPDELGMEQASAYDRWNVVTDLSKEFLPGLAEARPDYLVLDFFGDVHFGVLDVGEGRWVTNNRWKLWKTPFYADLKARGPLRTLTLTRDTEEYLDLWRGAYDRFVAHVRRVAPDTTVVVHCGRNTDTLLKTGDTTPVALLENAKLGRIDVQRYNALWDELNTYATESTGFARIDLWADRNYPTYAEHPWGPYYVHYVPEYYADFLAALSRLHLERTLASPERAMLTHLVETADSRRRSEIAALEAKLARQRAKLRRQARELDQAGAAPPPGRAADLVERTRRRLGALRR